MSGKGGTPRKHPGVRGPRPDRKAQRQLEAKERQARYDAERDRRLAQQLEASAERTLTDIAKLRGKTRMR